MLNNAIRFYAITFALSATMVSSASTAALLSASVGGVPVGAGVYENFDNLAGTGGLSAEGITVTFSGTEAGTATLPDAPGQYASPFISGSNGAPFGNLQANGPDQTQYLTTGIGQVSLELNGYHQYFGLLWGSVDDYNTLSFYDGNTLLFNFTGLNVDGMANGNQGAAGTFYVNINSDTPFNRVIASSTGYAFEFDNVALAVNPVEFPETGAVPEPGTLALLGLGLLGGIVTRHRRTGK
ncbi:putative secreted protein with PEP-CTERM sorting signal [Nitrosospira sp. Nsp5]|uniref:PEP-CTERM protein-sorting domain-containing protein n=1 Tax=Nitrosospira multiformis TaxID=1231 RepID=A0ABY0TH47_9PROT|nr:MULTISPECIES: PEP-CTERM sorting domain-containing protein [Nitrosospira]PTR10492.1 putative secreted protein with PEP-CTERM sorting signal [Nitrosospira sp. Nsp5]SDQ82573.1 PEP-CTERM protein-sorting domain-containing protein [Nitrosospira multiformis]